MKVTRNRISRYAREVLDFSGDNNIVSLESFFDCNRVIRTVSYKFLIELDKSNRKGESSISYKLTESGIYVPLRATICVRREERLSFFLKCCEEVEGYITRTNADMYCNYAQTKTLPGNKWEDFIRELSNLAEKQSSLQAKTS